MRVGDDALIVPLGPTTGRVVKYLPVPPVRSRGDVGIAPYANGRIFRSTRPDRMFQRCGPSSVRASPCHLPRGGRLPPGGGLFIPVRPEPVGVPSTPAAAAAPSPSRRGQGRWWKRGRLPCVKGAVSQRLTEGSPCCRLGPPHTRQGLWPCHPLPGEGRGFSPPSRLRRATSLYAREAFAQKPQSFPAISSAISL